MPTQPTTPTILAEILARKRHEVAERRALVPVRQLERSPYFATPPLSLRHYLTRPGSSGVIAEFKRRSPSKGWLNRYAPVGRTTLGYMQAGAAALSVITDEGFFGALPADLPTARRLNYCPILRKDFVVDEYQIIEAKSLGADAVLLIAAALAPAEVAALGAQAHALGLEVLLEIHDAEESHRTLTAAAEVVDLVGVNTRDLRDFSVDLGRAAALAPLIPSRYVAVAESGLRTAADIAGLRALGYQGFLIGETFMRDARPERACAALVRELAPTENQSASITV